MLCVCEIQVTVCPVTMDNCKCGGAITWCVVVTPLSPVNGVFQLQGF